MRQQEKELFLQTLGESLKKARGDRSQAEFARILGISQPKYQRYEKGAMMPLANILYQIATRIRIDMAELLTGKQAGQVHGFDIPQAKIARLSEAISKLATEFDLPDGDVFDAVIGKLMEMRKERASGKADEGPGRGAGE